MSEQILLICMLADGPVAVEGAIFNRRCSACNRAVMVAPSGQRMLRQYPAAEVLCTGCFDAKEDRKNFTVEPAASVEELRHEMRTARPNYHRYRN